MVTALSVNLIGSFTTEEWNQVRDAARQAMEAAAETTQPGSAREEIFCLRLDQLAHAFGVEVPMAMVMLQTGIALAEFARSKALAEAADPATDPE